MVACAWGSRALGVGPLVDAPKTPRPPRIYILTVCISYYVPVPSIHRRQRSRRPRQPTGDRGSRPDSDRVLLRYSCRSSAGGTTRLVRHCSLIGGASSHQPHNMVLASYCRRVVCPFRLRTKAGGYVLEVSTFLCSLSRPPLAFRLAAPRKQSAGERRGGDLPQSRNLLDTRSGVKKERQSRGQ